MGSAMWMIELAMNTITAEIKIGSHNAVSGTIIPPDEVGTETDLKFRHSLLWMESRRQLRGHSCLFSSRFVAHCAASATTGSGSLQAFCAMLSKRRSRLLPIAINAFRRRPERLVRFTG